MRIKSDPAVVCFQEVSQLATEEVSIFRLMGQAGRLSSLVVRQLDSGSKVCMFFCAQEELIMPILVRLCTDLF